MSIFDTGFIMITRVLLIFFYFNSLSVCSTVDVNIIYRPDMGRFGNQAEQFLGSAKHLDRINRNILVLPPFIEYRNYQVEFSPFDKFSKLEPLENQNSH